MDANVVRIDTLEDARLDAYARLTETQLRSRLEPEQAIFIAESRKVIERAFDGGMQPVSLLLEEKWLPSMEPLIARMSSRVPELAVFVAPHDVLADLTGFELTRGALAAFRRPTLPALDDVLAGARRVAVLEDITNHTNVGAIFRSAAALGIDAVLVTPGCHDPLYRRAVRVSMGTVFQVPWTRIGDKGSARTWAQTGIPRLQEAGFACVAMALADESVAIDDACLAGIERMAIVLGTEGEGLSPETIELCDWTARIPMMQGVDSLNVAAASAEAFWQLRSR